jgi:hypothetical protein
MVKSEKKKKTKETSLFITKSVAKKNRVPLY